MQMTLKEAEEVLDLLTPAYLCSLTAAEMVAVHEKYRAATLRRYGIERTELRVSPCMVCNRETCRCTGIATILIAKYGACKCGSCGHSYAAIVQYPLVPKPTDVRINADTIRDAEGHVYRRRDCFWFRELCSDCSPAYAAEIKEYVAAIEEEAWEARRPRFYE